MALLACSGNAGRVFWRRWLADRGSKAILGLALILVVYLGWQVFRWGGPGSREVIGDAAFGPVNLIAAALAFRVALTKTFRSEVRRAWLLIGLGLVAYLLGDMLQLYYEAVLHEAPYPTIADAAYLAFYPLLLAGIWQFPREPFHGFAIVRTCLDAAATVVAGAAIVWYVTLASATESGGSRLQLATSIAYPCGDLLLVLALTALAVRTRRILGSWALALIKTSLVLYVLADTVYGRLAMTGAYSGGDLIDAGWMFAIAMLAAAANEQYRVARDGLSPGEARRTDGAFDFLPYVATAVTFAFAVLSSHEEGRLEAGHLALLGAVLVIVLARLQWSTVDSRRNHQAAERARADFFATVSHELRTPLTAIRGFCELLADSDDVSGEAREFVQIIHRNALREERIVADLLFLNSTDFTRDLEIVPADLVQVVSDAIASKAPSAEQARVSIDWDPPEHEIIVHVDPQRLGQVVDNLLTNAVKFSGADSTVRVGVTVDSGAASVRVHDSGPGIPDEEKDHIFDRSYRGQFARSNAVPGAGLGLAIARGIVDAFDGSIGVEPHEGDGAVFRLDLPAVAVRPAGQSRDPLAPAPQLVRRGVYAMPG
jgi:signal transduction histidine kinase